MKKIISTTTAPSAIGPYSQGIAIPCKGTIIMTSGQIPINPDTNTMPDGIQAQTYQSLKNCEAVLDTAGAGLTDVIKTTVFLSDMNNFAAMNEVYSSFFKSFSPARSCVEVARLPKDALIEIECVAVIN